MRKLELKTTASQDNKLHELAFNARPSTKTVRVPLEALQNVLIDWGRLLNKLPDDAWEQPKD